MDSFEISFDHNKKIVRATVCGVMNQDDGEHIISTARKTAAEHKYNILYDITQATTKVGFANWYNLPRKLEVFKDAAAHKIKVAILASPDDEAVKDYKFYELVAGNLKLKIKVFFDEDAATDWLIINEPDEHFPFIDNA